MINKVLNILWLVFGGLWMGVGWYVFGIIMVISIVGVPWAKACFTIGTVGNVVWLIFGGIWLAIGHVVTAIGCFASIVGIPFGIQHLKIAGITLAPIGKTIVDKT